LVLALDPRASFDALRTAVRETFSQSPDRFRGADARLDLGPRPIDLFDLRRLIHVLKDEFGVTVAGLYCDAQNLRRFAERELKLKVYTHPSPASPAPSPASQALVSVPKETPTSEEGTESSPKPEPVPNAQDQTNRLLTVERSLRSGQIVRYGGDIVVYGDLNPGAEVIAGGNILVFGSIKGLAHAGARGNDGAHIVAFDFRPTQLRIGRKIAIPPESRNRRGGRQWTPEIAWVHGGEIIIDPYQGRLPS
jgi:septum site-determining protein MinC